MPETIEDESVGLGVDENPAGAGAEDAVGTDGLSPVPRQAAEEHEQSGQPETQKKCYRMAAWGDVCVYHNTCFDGSVWSLIDNRAKNHNVSSQPNLESHKDMLEGYLVPSKPVQSPERAIFPMNSGELEEYGRLAPVWLCVRVHATPSALTHHTIV